VGKDTYWKERFCKQSKELPTNKHGAITVCATAFIVGVVFACNKPDGNPYTQAHAAPVCEPYYKAKPKSYAGFASDGAAEWSAVETARG